MSVYRTVIVLTLVALGACKNNEETSTQNPTQSEPTKVVDNSPPEKAELKTVVPKGPMGHVIGFTLLDGDAPEMPQLQTGSDPVCAKHKLRAETIRVSDKSKKGGLANVVVRVKPGTVAAHDAPPEPVIVDQKDCMYRPRVSTAIKGQSIRVGNKDTTMHNVHAAALELGRRQATDTILNRAQPAGVAPIDVPTTEDDVVKLKCDTHGWMSGFVVVSDNPYSAISQSDGSFDLELPVGEHELEIWHEYYGVQYKKVTVVEDQALAMDFRFSVEDKK